MGAATVIQDCVQALKKRTFSQMGFCVLLHLWINRCEREISDPALDGGRGGVDFLKNIDKVSKLIQSLKECWFLKKKSDCEFLYTHSYS